MKTGLLGVERRALGEVWRRKGLFGAHLAGNAALIAATYGWLGIAEADWLAAVLSAALALLVIFAGLWLHAAALAAFHGARAGQALQRLPKVLPWALLAVAVVIATVWLAGFAPKVSAWLASLLTLRLRAAVSPRQVDWIFPVLLRGFACVLVLLLVPLASQAAGGAGVRVGLRVAAQPRYWLACAVLVFVGLYVPGRLIWWVPALAGLPARVASVAIRFGLAYVLAVTAWLTLVAAIAQLARGPANAGVPAPASASPPPVRAV